MTTMTLETTASASRPTLEELVDRLLAAVLGDGVERDADSGPNASLTRSIHQARRLRQSADPASGAGQALEGALSMLADADITGAADSQLRWLYAEWLDVARRRFTDGRTLLYSPATGRAAALMEGDEGSLEVVAVLGMRWPVGKLVSRRSLRGLKPLHKKGGATWS